jgi:hypothetical protein
MKCNISSSLFYARLAISLRLAEIWAACIKPPFDLLAVTVTVQVTSRLRLRLAVYVCIMYVYVCV